jgi:hypothetical protein
MPFVQFPFPSHAVNDVAILRKADCPHRTIRQINFAFYLLPFALLAFALPINFAFLRSVDLSKLDALVKKKNLQIVEQKIVRVRAGNVQPEVIDKLILLLQPFLPAGLTDFVINARAQFVRKRRKRHLLVLAPAARAFKFIARK